MHQLKQKHCSDFDINIEEIQIKPEAINRKDPSQSKILWKTVIYIHNHPDNYSVEAFESNKQKSKQIAALRFLDKIYNQGPLGSISKYYTWKTVVKNVATNKKPLQGIIELNIKQFDEITLMENEQNDLTRLKNLFDLIKYGLSIEQQTSSLMS